MQPCLQTEIHEDSLQLGPNFIANLENLSENSAKVVLHFMQLK